MKPIEPIELETYKGYPIQLRNFRKEGQWLHYKDGSTLIGFQLTIPLEEGVGRIRQAIDASLELREACRIWRFNDN